jgi:hypothetical protein
MNGSSNNGRSTDNVVAFPQSDVEETVSPVGVARHRRHQFPGRTESVRARYDADELAAVAAAADRAGLTTSGYVAAAALAAASGSEPPDASGDRELLGELLQARLAVRRYAGERQPGDRGVAQRRRGAGVVERAVAGCDRAVSRLDELTVRLLQRRS